MTLVPLGPEHLARTREWANNPELMRLMDRAKPVTEAEHEAWFKSIVRRTDCAYFAIEIRPTAFANSTVAHRADTPYGETGRARHVGNIWLWAIDERHRKAELRVVIGEADARGQGLGAEAIDRLCRHAFDELGLHRIYAYVLASNPGARRAFERAGFLLDGTLRDDRWTGERFVDAYLMGRLKPAT